MVKGKKEPEVIYAMPAREEVAQFRRFQAAAPSDESRCCLLSRPAMGRCARHDERGRKDRRGAYAQYLYSLYERAPAPSRSSRRRTTGTALLRC